MGLLYLEDEKRLASIRTLSRSNSFLPVYEISNLYMIQFFDGYYDRDHTGAIDYRTSTNTIRQRVARKLMLKYCTEATDPKLPKGSFPVPTNRIEAVMQCLGLWSRLYGEVYEDDFIFEAEEKRKAEERVAEEAARLARLPRGKHHRADIIVKAEDDEEEMVDKDDESGEDEDVGEALTGVKSKDEF